MSLVRDRQHLLGVCLIVTVGALAFAARLIPVVRGAGLGSTLFYDDGVYYTAASSLAAGRVPYRDFLLLHPPGIAVLVAPFAVVGRWTTDPVGLATARIAFMLLGATCAVLVAMVARRLSLVAGMVAGAFYAVWPPAAHTETSTLLEPIVNLGIATALFALRDPRSAGRARVIVAGAALGGACAFKVWAVVPLAVVACWVARRASTRVAGWLLGGAVCVFGAVCLPFFLLAPSAMPRMVLIDQLGRSGNRVGTGRRVADVFALPPSLTSASTLPLTLAAVAVAVAMCVVGVAVVRSIPMARPWAALLAANLATLLVVTAFFSKYADFASVPLALMVGATAHQASVLVRDRRPALNFVTAVAMSVSLVVIGVASIGARSGHDAHAHWLQSTLASSSCVSADDPIVLIQGDALSRDLSNDCEVAADPTGESYDLHPGRLRVHSLPSDRKGHAAWQAWMADYLIDPHVFVLARVKGTGLSPATLRCLAGHQLVATRAGIAIYRGSTMSRPEGRSMERAEARSTAGARDGVCGND